MSNNKPVDWNKWMLIYDGSDSGVEYLSQAEHDAFLEASRVGSFHCELLDGRLLPIIGGRIRPNPEWHDPVRIAQLREANTKRQNYIRENFKRKYGGEPLDTE